MNIYITIKDPVSPTQLDPFFQEGGEPNYDPHWITVFGFTTAATSFVLQGMINHIFSEQVNRNIS